eukprot:1907074-Pyramimonas_sp.AAC.1
MERATDRSAQWLQSPHTHMPYERDETFFHAVSAGWRAPQARAVAIVRYPNATCCILCLWYIRMAKWACARMRARS